MFAGSIPSVHNRHFSHLFIGFIALLCKRRTFWLRFTLLTITRKLSEQKRVNNKNLYDSQPMSTFFILSSLNLSDQWKNSFCRSASAVLIYCVVLANPLSLKGFLYCLDWKRAPGKGKEEIIILKSRTAVRDGHENRRTRESSLEEEEGSLVGTA